MSPDPPADRQATLRHLIGSLDHQIPEQAAQLFEALRDYGLALLESQDYAEALEVLAFLRDMCNGLDADSRLRQEIRAAHAIAVALAEPSQASRQVLEVAAAEAVRVLGPAHGYSLLANLNLARLREYLGDLDGALILYRSTIPLFLANESAEPAEIASVAVHMSRVERSAGSHDVSHATLETAFAALSPRMPSNDNDLLYLRTVLGVSLVERGDIVHGWAHLEAVESAISELDLAASERGAVLCADFAVAKLDLRDLSGALLWSHRAERAIAAARWADDHDLLLARLNVASVRMAAGDIRGGLDILLALRAAWEGKLPTTDARWLSLLHNVAAAYIELGEGRNAREILEAVYSKRLAQLGVRHPSVLRTGINLGFARAMVGDHLGAVEVLEGSLREHGGLPPFHPDLVRLKKNLGVALRRAGDKLRGTGFLEEVHRAWRTCLPPGHVDLARSCEGLAQAYASDGQLDRARAIVLEALHGYGPAQAVHMTLLGAESEVGPESDRLLSQLLSFSPDPFDPTTELSVAISLRGLAERRGRIGQLARSAAKDDRALRDRMEAAMAAARLRTEAIHHHGDVASARIAERAAEHEFARYMIRESALAATLLAPPDLGALSRRLPGDGICILFQDYIEMRSWLPSAGERQTAAFVCTSQTAVTRVELGDTRGLHEDILRVVQGMQQNPREDAYEAHLVSGGLNTVGRDQAALFTRLRPVLSLIAGIGARTLWLCPSGGLAAMPWEALWIGDRYLGDLYDIRYLENMPALEPRPVPASTSQALVVGGIDFGIAPDAGLVEFASLEGSHSEATDVALAFGKHRIPTKRLDGKIATRNAFFAEAQRSRWIHIATHSWVDSNIRTIGLSREPGLSQATDRFAHVPDRTFQSGLAFAGVNRHPACSSNPELLLTAEILRMDLSECILANLSACRTNVGERLGGEAIAGLARAFLVAGARNVLATHWAILDAPTAQLQSEFYQRLLQQQRPVYALRESCRSARSRGDGPRVWAAFCLYETGGAEELS